MTPDVATVVIAYGAEDLLEDCLACLDPNVLTVVVDNASREACRSVCERYGAQYVDAGANLGFAGGVNLAVEVIGPELDVLLLNPDARLTAEGVNRLASILDATDGVACVAPAQREPGTGEGQRVGWPFPSPRRRWFEAVGGSVFVRTNEFLVGSVLLISRAALRDVGPFDERYFLYCEETDWQRRAAARGWRMVLVDDVLAEHVGAGTSASSIVREAYFHAGQETYIRKWFGARGWDAYRLACMTGDFVRILAGGARAKTARERLAIYREGPVRYRDRLLAESLK